MDARSMIARIFLLVVVVMLGACKNFTSNQFQQPTLQDYTVGEKWIWKYKGVTPQGEVKSEGIDIREVVDYKGTLGITIGIDTIPVSEIIQPTNSQSPKYDWPLKVGKKWKYESSWTSQDGTKGHQNQTAQVISYQEETIEAGTFMAFTIEYVGTTSNSRGYLANEKEIWLYAPEIKNFIKLTQIQDDFHYEEELVQYFHPEKSVHP